MQRRCSWLQDKKNDDEKREESHWLLASRMIASAEGGAIILHNNHEPTAWRGLQVLEELEEDAKPMKEM